MSQFSIFHFSQCNSSKVTVIIKTIGIQAMLANDMNHPIRPAHGGNSYAPYWNRESNTIICKFFSKITFDSKKIRVPKNVWEEKVKKLSLFDEYTVQFDLIIWNSSFLRIISTYLCLCLVIWLGKQKENDHCYIVWRFIGVNQLVTYRYQRS